MYPQRPGRIEGFNYLGQHRYFITICTSLREPLFSNPAVVESVLMTLRQRCATYWFSLLAYCFMSDHVHVLVQGMADDSDLQQLIARWKQATGFRHKRETGKALWQESYHDHVLRDDEETWRAARYILENPVRKGLVTDFSAFAHSGSDVFGAEELKTLWERQG